MKGNSYDDFKAKYGEKDYSFYSLDKATNAFSSATHDLWDLASSIACFDNKMTPRDFMLELAKFEDMVKNINHAHIQLMKLVLAFERVWSYPEPVAHVEDTGFANVDALETRIQASTEVSGIDEEGEKYDLESPTTMRDLA